MAIWKKSEDPWDVAPAGRRIKRAREENPLDALKGWSKERRAKAAAREAEWEAQPKEVCPWCGEAMERGCLQGGGRGVYWYPGRHTASAAWWGPGAIEESFQVDDEGGLLKGAYKTAWYCRTCGRIVTAALEKLSGDAPAQAGEADAGEPERSSMKDAGGDGGDL